MGSRGRKRIQPDSAVTFRCQSCPRGGKTPPISRSWSLQEFYQNGSRALKKPQGSKGPACRVGEGIERAPSKSQSTEPCSRAGRPPLMLRCTGLHPVVHRAPASTALLASPGSCSHCREHRARMSIQHGEDMLIF